MARSGMLAAAVALAAAASAAAQTEFDFAPPVILPIGFDQYPTSIDAGDIDEDGWVDLVCAGRNNDGRVVIFYGGPAGFGAPADLVMAGQTNWALLRHLDGDGHLDLAITNRQGLGRVSVILGNGTRALPAPADYPAGRIPTPLRAGDLDGDGDLDLLSFNWGTFDLTVLHNDGRGAFTAAQSVHANRLTTPSPAWPALADLDGDGDLDIAVVSLTANGVIHMLSNRGDGTFDGAIQHRVAGVASNEAIAALAAADVDGDGDVDLVTKAGSANFIDRLIVLANQGGAFDTAVELALTPSLGGSPWEITTGDFDGDAHTDLAWVTHFLSNQSAAFLRNSGTGAPAFAQPEQRVALGGFPRAVLATDLDADTDLDLVVANIGDQNVAVIENLRLSPASAAPPLRRQAGKAPLAPGERAALPRSLADWGAPLRGSGGRRPAGAGEFPACGDPGAGDCFEPHANGGCDDAKCCALVCADDVFCCEGEWDQGCADLAADICEPPPVCPAKGSCLEPHPEPGCDDVTCCELICLVDEFCCGGPWDRLCADEAALLCGRAPCEPAACPDGATPEPETTNCFDRTNDGCNLLEPAFTPIACGETVCGNAWNNGNRDTDWYSIAVDKPSTLLWRVDSEFPAEVFIVTGSCDDTFTVAAAGFALPCEPASVPLSVEPGVYMLFVAPGTASDPILDGIGCIGGDGKPVGGGAYGGRYLARVTCGPACAADTSGDGHVGIEDLLGLLGAWGDGTPPGTPPDLDGDGTVDYGDLERMLAAWGPC